MCGVELVSLLEQRLPVRSHKDRAALDYLDRHSSFQQLSGWAALGLASPAMCSLPFQASRHRLARWMSVPRVASLKRIRLVLSAALASCVDSRSLRAGVRLAA